MDGADPQSSAVPADLSHEKTLSITCQRCKHLHQNQRVHWPPATEEEKTDFRCEHCRATMFSIGPRRTFLSIASCETDRAYEDYYETHPQQSRRSDASHSGPQARTGSVSQRIRGSPLRDDSQSANSSILNHTGHSRPPSSTSVPPRPRWRRVLQPVLKLRRPLRPIATSSPRMQGRAGSLGEVRTSMTRRIAAKVSRLIRRSRNARPDKRSGPSGDDPPNPSGVPSTLALDAAPHPNQPLRDYPPEPSEVSSLAPLNAPPHPNRTVIRPPDQRLFSVADDNPQHTMSSSEMTRHLFPQDLSGFRRFRTEVARRHTMSTEAVPSDRLVELAHIPTGERTPESSRLSQVLDGIGESFAPILTLFSSPNIEISETGSVNTSVSQLPGPSRSATPGHLSPDHVSVAAASSVTFVGDSASPRGSIGSVDPRHSVRASRASQTALMGSDQRRRSSSSSQQRSLPGRRSVRAMSTNAEIEPDDLPQAEN